MSAYKQLETKRRLETLGITIRSAELSDLAQQILAGIVREKNGKLERRDKGANRDLSNRGTHADVAARGA